MRKTDEKIIVEPERFHKLRGHSLLKFDSDEILKLAESMEVISFDVFDTILHRRVMHPTCVFGLMEEKLGLLGFSKERSKAEVRARVERRGSKGAETCLDEIYACLKRQTDYARADQELQIEARITFPNLHVADLIKHLRMSGKRVIAVSDMYLLSPQIESLLSSHGIEVDKVYSSADYREQNIGKYNGEMYQKVVEAEHVEPDKILHIGDNTVSDVQNAQAAGLVAIGTHHPLPRLSFSRPDFALVHKVQNNPTASLAAGIIQRDHLNSLNPAPDLKTFGYDFGGPLVAGFVQFIRERCAAEGISHLVLLARDGYVVKEVLDILGSEGLSYRVVPASRRMTVFPLLADEGPNAIEGLFTGQPEKLSKRKILRLLDLEHLVFETEYPDTDIPLKTALAQMAPLLTKQAHSERAALLSQFETEKQLVAQGQKFAWVDVGWALSSIKALKKALDLKMPAFFIGSHSKADHQKDFDGYLFTRGLPRQLCETVMSAPELVELIFSDVMPSVSRLEQTNNSVEAKFVAKSQYERVRDIAVRQVREGVLSFARDFSEFQDLANTEDLRDFNRKIWAELISRCPPQLSAELYSVPHDQMGASAQWKTIGQHWTGAADTSLIGQITKIVEPTLRPFPRLYRFAQSTKEKISSS